MSNTTRTFDTYVSRGVMLNNYANIFGLIMQMRQVSDHPDLLLKKHAAEGQNVLVCNICDEPAEDAIRSKCKHDFCRSCVKDYVRSVEAAGGSSDCPRCHIVSQSYPNHLKMLTITHSLSQLILTNPRLSRMKMQSRRLPSSIASKWKTGPPPPRSKC